MKYKSFILLAGLIIVCGCKKSNPINAPNFVFFLVDDLGWTDLGCYGSTFYETPNIDKLATEGVLFTDAYAASPVCSPTRASILTGKNPCIMGTTDWFGAVHPDNVPPDYEKSLLPAPYQDQLNLEEITIAESLKGKGYATFIAGKWHLGETEEFWPENQGFDVNKGGYSKGRPHKESGANGYFSPYGNPRLNDGPVGEYLTDRLTAETISFIEQNKDHPFFVFFSFYNVHTPLMAKEDRIAYYEAKKMDMGLEDNWDDEGDIKVRTVQCHPTYAAMVEAVDGAVGMVLEKLNSLGIDKNTIILFMSDNGGLSTAGGYPTSNYPLRAGKGWLYEGGIREPMIIKWPRIAIGGVVCNTPVISTDFFPTIMEMAGLDYKSIYSGDGMSLVPLLLGQQLSREAIFWHYPHYSNQGGDPASAVREGEWKLIRHYEEERYELYNLLNDIGEKVNLAESQAGKTEELKIKLQDYLDKNDAKYPERYH